MTAALDDVVAAVHRSGDTEACDGVRVVVAELGADAATRILTAHDDTDPAAIKPARLAVRLRDVLEQRGGAVSHEHLLTHLEAVLNVPSCQIRAVIDEEVAAGALDLEWANPHDDFRTTLTVRRVGL